jgi:hypothetical protein
MNTLLQPIFSICRQLRSVLWLLLCCSSGIYAQVQLPNDGLLPHHRIVSYYGNFYSHKMGVLGQYPPHEMLEMLQNEVTNWQEADPNTPVIPAIEYIAVVAQGSPGADGKYRARMPKDQIEKAIALAEEVNGIVILDVQIGLSDVEAEIPRLEPYLAMPNVMLALDPEFSMKEGSRPGKRIGTMDADEINYVAEYLAKIVRENHLPPKILIVHRFTQHMVTHAKEIRPLPEVQIVLDMDGWGDQAKKRSTYHDFIAPEAVQFTGVKLFYINDLKPPSTGLFTPEQILRFKPTPVFIMYQ